MDINKFIIFCMLVTFSFVFANEEEKKKEKVKKLQIGVKKRVENENCPVKSRKGSLLHVYYKGLLEDGTEFDSNYSNDRPPLTFTLGYGQVVKGWDQGLLGMCEGEIRKLVIPPDLAYGASGVPPKIPPEATLIFHVELIKIEQKEEL